MSESSDTQVWIAGITENQAFALAEVLDAAEAYARACDRQDYPQLHVLAEKMKSAARRYRWAIDDVVPPERVAKLHGYKLPEKQT